MAQDVDVFFAELGDKPSFRPEPWYNAPGDCMIFHFAPDEHYADRIDDLVTVYRSFEHDRIVGCQVKGIGAVVRKFGDFGVSLGTKQVHLNMLFFVCHVMAADPTDNAARRRDAYYTLLRRASGQTIEVPDLVEA